ncbi:MAG: hypothetical protein AB7E51_15140 [Pseudodesulfovibrio sp.]|uniref:hypothetical protein n=1 Tax=Pseudodesulfovibrio sp. TaxID=2035812 RepID=UPI003D0E2E34
MGNLRVIPSLPEHIPYVAGNMRAEEVAEVWAAGHATPGEALERALAASDMAWTVFEGERDVPMAMFGRVRPSLMADTGALWCLVTDDVSRWKVPFAKRSREYVAVMLNDVERLENYIDVRCRGGIVWLRWLGALLDDPKPMGPDKMLFQRFEIRREG